MCKACKKVHSMYLLMTPLSLVTETISQPRQRPYHLSSGSLKADSHKRISKVWVDSVEVQEDSWGKGGNEPAEDFTFHDGEVV